MHKYFTISNYVYINRPVNKKTMKLRNMVLNIIIICSTIDSICDCYTDLLALFVVGIWFIFWKFCKIKDENVILKQVSKDK